MREILEVIEFNRSKQAYVTEALCWRAHNTIIIRHLQKEYP